MKSIPQIVLTLAALAATLLNMAAQTTAFTYQGRLDETGAPANGSYDLRFTIYDAADSGTQQGNALTNAATPVTDGLFTVTPDFGNQFPGADRWLEVAVRTNGSGAFSTLLPRQAILPTPYAMHADYAGDIQPGANVSFSANGVVSFHSPTPFYLGPLATNMVNNLNAQFLAGKDAGRFWWLGGNSGQLPTDYVLGTLENQPLELKVNGQRALRLEPNATSPNVIGGYSGNIVNNTMAGGFIGGGGESGYPNRVGGHYGAVVGGSGNTASGNYSTAMGNATTASGGGSTAMGNATTASGGSSTAMGAVTTASGNYATAMGLGTTASGTASIALGNGTTASGIYSVALGTGSTASGTYSTAMGVFSKANHDNTFVWADGTDSSFGSSATNQFLVNASGGVGIGTTTPGAMLQVGDANTPNSQGMIRLASRSGTGGGNRYWDIGVPENDENFAGKSYAFVIDDPQLGAEPEVVVRWDTGNMGIGVTNPATRLHVNGTVTATAFNPPSDRNLKENFTPVDPQEVLAKVAALPISRWNFIGDSTTPHVGPMAQDFHAAFGVGTDDKHIATVDADGVALAAIQGLSQILQQKETEITELKQRLAKLEQQLDKNTQ